MELNEYLDFILGVYFESKYVTMAILEILNNKKKYPSIYLYIEDMVEYDDNGQIAEIRLKSTYFICEDPEFLPTLGEAMELYKAFMRVFWKDLQNKKHQLTNIIYAFNILRQPTLESALYPYVNYSGCYYINLTKNETEFTKTIYVPEIIDGEYWGRKGEKNNTEICSSDNSEVFKKIEEVFNMPEIIEDLFIPRFCDEELKTRKWDHRNGLTGYGFISIEFLMGNNVIKFFATERGYDPLSAIFRLPIIDSLSEEEKEIEVTEVLINL